MNSIEKDIIDEQWKKYEVNKFRTHIKNTLLSNAIVENNIVYANYLLDYLNVPRNCMDFNERLTYYELFIKETI